MTVFDLYQKKESGEKVQLRHKDVDAYLKANANEVDLEAVKYLVLLTDVYTIDTVVEKVNRLFSRLDCAQRKSVFEELTSHIDKVEIRTLLNYLIESDFDENSFFFDSFIENNSIVSVDKLILLESILNVCKSTGHSYIYDENLLKYCREVLLDSDSAKSAVRLAVSLLRSIEPLSSDNMKYSEAISSLYVKNEIWKDFYTEEISHRHKTLLSSFGDKVNEAFKKKQFQRVVNLIGKYEHELPDILKKKLTFSKKQMKNN